MSNWHGPGWAIRTVLAAMIVSTAAIGDEPAPRKAWTPGDKTFVAWASPANTFQRGGSVITIQEPGKAFDALVFGELATGRWMAGSEGFRRSTHDQNSWPQESADPRQFVQVAIAYRGKEVSIYRDGKPYAHYTMPSEPAAFDEKSIVLLGLRHIEILGGPTFRGEVEDARIPANAGRWRLTTGDAPACEPAAEAPDLAMTAADLASVYLGGTSPVTLARVGAIRAAEAATAWANRLNANP